jgi:hypothetical protein
MATGTWPRLQQLNRALDARRPHEFWEDGLRS